MTRAGSEEQQRTNRARRLGFFLYSAVVVVPVTIWASQILEQVYDPHGDPTDLACRAGVAALIRAVHRARIAAGSELGGERPALQKFRDSLNPEWRWRPALGRRCLADRDGARAMETADLFRYAEEHAVRYEARDVARLRRAIQTFEGKSFGGPAQPAHSSGPAIRSR